MFNTFSLNHFSLLQINYGHLWIHFFVCVDQIVGEIFMSVAPLEIY